MNISKLISRAELPSWLNSVKRTDGGGVSINGVEIKTNGYIANVPKSILREAPATPSGNVGAGEDNILAFDIPIATLPTDLDYVKGVVSGGIAANDTNKAVRFYVNSIGIITPPTTDLDGAQGWVLRFEIIRVNDTTVRVSATLEIDALAIDSAGTVTITTGILMQASQVQVTVSDLDTNVLPILVTGEGAANNDVTKSMTIIEACQQ